MKLIILVYFLFIKLIDGYTIKFLFDLARYQNEIDGLPRKFRPYKAVTEVPILLHTPQPLSPSLLKKRGDNKMSKNIKQIAWEYYNGDDEHFQTYNRRSPSSNVPDSAMYWLSQAEIHRQKNQKQHQKLSVRPSGALHLLGQDYFDYIFGV
ncbi:hypothetical protein O0L34_g15333 [Tuta absoluta]|nr:hypothetical protein O0L34_g15333 [Tuta absoluta]